MAYTNEFYFAKEGQRSRRGKSAYAASYWGTNETWQLVELWPVPNAAPSLKTSCFWHQDDAGLLKASLSSVHSPLLQACHRQQQRLTHINPWASLSLTPKRAVFPISIHQNHDWLRTNSAWPGPTEGEEKKKTSQWFTLKSKRRSIMMLSNLKDTKIGTLKALF